MEYKIVGDNETWNPTINILDQSQIYTDFFGEFISSYIQLPQTIDRTLPLALYHPIEVEHKTSFLFPEEINWTLDYNPLVIKDAAVLCLATQ